MSSSPAKTPVYLRGIPSEVVREAKAAAARRGVTLAGFVAETLARALRQPDTGGDQTADLNGDIRWYERNREQIGREHAGEYVAILGRKLIDHDADFEVLAERVFAREGVRNVFMPHVGAERRPMRVRSPRVRQRVNQPARPARRR